MLPNAPARCLWRFGGNQGTGGGVQTDSLLPGQSLHYLVATVSEFDSGNQVVIQHPWNKHCQQVKHAVPFWLMA